MPIAAFSRLHRALCSSSRGRQLGLTAAQCRYVSHSVPSLDDHADSETGPRESGDASENDNVDTSEMTTPRPPPPPANNKPYNQHLRQIMAEKYLANQPLAKPHRLCSKEKKKKVAPRDFKGLHDLRVEYRTRLSALRKEYAREVEQQKSAKATHDKKQREEVLRAKEERLRLKKEKSAQRALEVEAEKQLLQAQLAKERAERQAYRKKIDMKVDERRQKEKDIIRQKSGTWVTEEDLEQRIAEALSNPIDL